MKFFWVSKLPPPLGEKEVIFWEFLIQMFAGFSLTIIDATSLYLHVPFYKFKDVKLKLKVLTIKKNV